MKHLFSAFLLAASLTVYSQDKVKDSIQELDEVVIEKKKKAVERKADRTIFDFSEQSHLNSGSLLEGLTKLPGLIVSEVAGMLYQGKQLEVYMDGRPLNIYSNELTAYLEGMPANAIEKVEIITQPGAEFPATSGGAIINIITSKKAQKFLSATYSNGYSYTRYGTSRHRFNNSLMLSAANNLFSWQVQGGQSYSENYLESVFRNGDILLTNNNSDRCNRFYYLKTGVKFDFKKDRLLINYDINSGRNTSYIKASGYGFTADDKSTSKPLYHDVMLTYQKRFEDPLKKLDVRFNFNNSSSDFNLNSNLYDYIVLNNSSKQDFYQFKADYSQEVSLLDKTKISAGMLGDKLDFEAASFGLTNLDYTRTSLAAYTEAQATVKKFDFIVGGRIENYSIEGTTGTTNLIPFHKTRFFPNATIQYNVMPQVRLNANYNRKIRLPNTSLLNPNNTNYQNPNVAFFGNPNLEPTMLNNYEIQFNAFEYFFISYSVTMATNQVINRIISTPTGAASITENLPEARIRNFNVGIPLPYMLFTKGLQETLKMNFNPDEINFLYVYAGTQKHVVPGLDTKSVLSFNLMSQIVLPKKIKFVANFNTTSGSGNYYYYTIKEPLYQQLNVTFSKKFLSDDLSVSLYANDIFNTNRQVFGIAGTGLYYSNKYDFRRIGFSLSYRLPGKNRKEDTSILTNDKKQDETIIGN